ncbi:Armadillo-type fold domain containing protein [Cordyceps militaris CM01]|uniref:Armadillo-type fold domain containing protein n=1 Tax=Cordyceps militaris (strain CM01) TaxID=983644 RepID=G3JC87_CORMM|nr:Armadillo-type fold domain containing protein [Cordyceps militaris CM01]EGX93752.1 Armadillo-type fold domain containing protein [Cordyceps militaris CM01]
MNAARYTRIEESPSVLSRVARSAAACLGCSMRPPDRSPSEEIPRADGAIRLHQVNPDKTEYNTDIDIIAIHGLNTRSPGTWTWRRPTRFWARIWASHPEEPGVNWLQDERMLPAQVGNARIFTCDWPADLYQPSDLVSQGLDKYSEVLLHGIQGQLMQPSDSTSEDRPLFFIASCFGGIALINALVNANDMGKPCKRIEKATQGIIFLATPFRGTSFKNISYWAQPSLAASAHIQGRELTQFIKELGGSTEFLEKLVRNFSQLWMEERDSSRLCCFYERRRTKLLRKVLPACFLRGELLVSSSSAKLDVAQSLPLERTHVLMNKFEGPDCGQYERVVGQIKNILGSIRENTPLQQADNMIVKEYCDKDRLTITRLSGAQLKLEHCYINLTIAEKQSSTVMQTDFGSSPVSRLAREGVETVDQRLVVRLKDVFKARNGTDKTPTRPQRVLIRGRAGVGKTTLCKKIVHEFVTKQMWCDIFDRILWIPLRHLKRSERTSLAGYNMERLLLDEFFYRNDYSNNQGSKAFAKKILQAKKDNRTLFLLDGWDEVDQLANSESDMQRFLVKELYEEANVIITTRPSASLPVHKPFHLELETIGFDDTQIQSYVNMASEKCAGDIFRFLEQYELVESLVRIPVQLDALCFCWDDSPIAYDNTPETMTILYQNMQTSLWKKDIARLDKRIDGNKVQLSDLVLEDQYFIEKLVEKELHFLESLAFWGLLEDLVEFELPHRNTINKSFRLPLAKVLPALSFLRTSDPNANDNYVSYHFIHLTYQEYYAARFFTRHWVEEKRMKCPSFSKERDEDIHPVEFLQQHRYNPRYNIMWRFVAGLLNTEYEVLKFLGVVEQQLDLLGPSHQRIIMQLLSEISPSRIKIDAKRASLERDLSNLLLLEIQVSGRMNLSWEAEFPQTVLEMAFREANESCKCDIMASLIGTQVPPDFVLKFAHPDRPDDIICVLKALFSRTALPERFAYYLAERYLELERKSTVWGILLKETNETTLSQAFYTHLLARLQGHFRKEERDIFQKTAHHQSEFPQAFIEALLDLVLNSTREEGEWNDIFYWPEVIQEAAFARLKSTNVPKIRGAGFWAFRNVARNSSLGKERCRKIANELLGCLEYLGIDMPDDILWCFSSALEVPAASLKAVVKRLDGSTATQAHALRVLSRLSDLPEEIIRAATQRLESSAPRVRKAAFNVLDAQEILPKHVCLAIIRRLPDVGPHDRAESMPNLHKFEPCESMIQALNEQLKDFKPEVVKASLIFIGQLGQVPETLCGVMMELLAHSSEDIRESAAWSLKKGTIQGIDKYLLYPKPEVRMAALAAVTSQNVLPDEALRAIVRLLTDPKPEVRVAALEALRTQNILPDEVLRAMFGLLTDSMQKVQETAFGVVGRQRSLPDETHRAIVGLLTSSEQCWAIGVLRHQHHLTAKTLEEMVEQLKNSDVHMRDRILALLTQKWAESGRILSDDIVQGLCGWIEGSHSERESTFSHDDLLRRCCTLAALRDHLKLPSSIVANVARQLRNSQRDIRPEALWALKKQLSVTPLTSTKFRVLNTSLDKWLQSQASQVLHIEEMPNVFFRAVARELEDGAGNLEMAIKKTLFNGSKLAPVLTDIISQRLAEKEPGVRELTLRTLEQEGQAQPCLGDRDHMLRLAAPDCLKQRTLQNLEAVSQKLTNSMLDLKRACFEISETKFYMKCPESVVDAVGKLLRDSQPVDVQKGALHYLCGRECCTGYLSCPEDFPPAVLVAVVESFFRIPLHSLPDASSLPALPEAAIQALVFRSRSDSALVVKTWKAFLRNLLLKSFKQHLTFWFRDGSIWVTDESGERKVEVDLDGMTADRAAQLFCEGLSDILNGGVWLHHKTSYLPGLCRR